MRWPTGVCVALTIGLTAGCGASESRASQVDATGSGAFDPDSASAVDARQATSDPSTTTPPSQEIPLAGTETERDWQILMDRIEWARSEGLADAPMGEAVARIGQTFVGQPYTPRTLEVPGPEALVVNLREFDCVTFVESVLSLARVVQATPASLVDPDALKARYISELAGLRYRGGRIDGYPSRLHYFSEWIAENAAAGRLEPISHLLGGVETNQTIDFMSTHADAYAQLEDPANLAAIQAVEERLSAVPLYPIRENRIAQFAEDIQSGDIIAATSTVDGLDVAHTGIALWQDGELRLMHAPLVGELVQISESTLAERVTRIRGQDGIFVARPLSP